MKTLRIFLPLVLTAGLSWSMSSDSLVQSGRKMPSGSVAGPVRSSQDGSDGAQNDHAMYQQGVRDGNFYVCSSTLTLATYPGLNLSAPLALYNPVGSNKSLVLIEDGVAPTGAQVASIFSLAYSSGSPAAAGTPLPSYENANIQAYPGSYKAAPVGICFSSATLATQPIAFRYIGSETGAAITSFPIVDKPDGEVIIAPGMAVAFQATGSIAMQNHFVWEEIPYP